MSKSTRTASAVAAIIFLACGVTNRDEALLIGVHPAWAQVTRTYVEGLGISVIEAPAHAGVADQYGRFPGSGQELAT